MAEGLESITGPLTQHTDRLVRAIADYDHAAKEEFLIQHDSFRLVGQDNLRRYLPVRFQCIRVQSEDNWFEIVARVAAANAVGCRAIVSAPEGTHEETLGVLHDLTESWAGSVEFLRQTDEELAEMIEWDGVGRVRYAAAERVPDLIRRAVIGRYIYIADGPVLPVGRIELLSYVQEQSISHNYHRYGNLGRRQNESRATVL